MILEFVDCDKAESSCCATEHRTVHLVLCECDSRERLAMIMDTRDLISYIGALSCYICGSISFRLGFLFFGAKQSDDNVIRHDLFLKLNIYKAFDLEYKRMRFESFVV
jgi:hypothetical protein